MAAVMRAAALVRAAPLVPAQALVRAAALILAAAVTLAACSPAPRSIVLGAEECSHCRMMIDDARFAAQAVTRTGRTYSFDAVECLAGWISAGSVSAEEIHSLWVADFDDPDRWLRAEKASYLRSEAVHSPMGAGLTAHVTVEAARSHLGGSEGSILDWAGVLRHLEVGGGHEHHHSSGHDAAHHHDGGPAAVTVRPGEPGALAAALAGASPGDRIRVPAGVYREGSLVIDLPLTLEGEPGAILDGEGRHPILIVRADGVTIRGLTFRRSASSHVHDHAALRFDSVRDCVAEGNILEDNFFGIYLARVRGCRVVDNRLRASAERVSASANGIHAWNSSDLVITGNTVRRHRDGIYLEHVRDAYMADNRSEDNLRYGLHFMFSSGLVFLENEFRRNSAGVAVMYSERVRVERNAFEDNWGSASYGLLLKDIRDSEITDNRFVRNTVALYSEGSARVVVDGNRFSRNGWAVRVLASSHDNRFTGNDFVDNAFDVTTNSRRNFNTFDGNFWSAYRGYDLTGDGVGDVPHRPVRLFSLLVERNPIALVLLRSVFIDLLDVAERVLPVLTPETLVDDRPRMTEQRTVAEAAP